METNTGMKNFIASLALSLVAGLLTILPAQELSLSDAIQKALANNFGITLAEYDQEIARISNSWGEAGRYPAIDLDLGSTNNVSLAKDNNTGSNRLSGGVGLGWTLFNGFRVNLTKDKLAKFEDLAEGRLAVEVENTIQDVIDAYYFALLQQERKKVFEKVTALSRDRFEAEEELKELGSSLSYEVLQAKNLYLSDQYNLLNQEILISTTVRNLNYLMAENLNQNWNIVDPFEHIPQDFAAEELLSKLQSNNTLLQNQYIYLEISHTEKELAKSAFFPNVGLSTGLSNSYTNQFILSENNSTSTAISPYANLTLRYNLYSGGKRNRAVQIAEISENIAQVETQDMEQLVSNQLMNEYDAYQVRKIQLDVASESLEAAEINLGIAEEKLKTGAINSFNYRDIQLVYLNTAIQRLQAIYALIQSHTNLTRLTGGFVNE